METLMQTTLNRELQLKAMSDSTALVRRAKELSVAIKDEASLQEAVDFCLLIRRKRKEWEKINAPEKQALNAAKQAFQDRVNQVDEPMERAEREILSPSITRFRTEQERKRKEDEDKIRAAQRKVEEDERLRKAADLEKEGKKEEAEDVLETPLPVAPAVLPKQKVDGASFRTDWTFELIDANAVPREYMVVDMVKIARVVRAMKDQAQIAGIKVYPKQVLVQGRD